MLTFLTIDTWLLELGIIWFDDSFKYFYGLPF